MSKPNIIVIGGGSAGLMATIKAVEKGATVKVFSLVPPKKIAFSLCARRNQRGNQHHRGGRLSREPLPGNYLRWRLPG